MKINKLLCSLAALSLFVLSGCANGNEQKSNPIDSKEDSQTSETTSEDTTSEDETSEKTSESHTHQYVFQNFVWTETPGNYTAKAHYECLEDHETIDYDAAVEKTVVTEVSCLVDGKISYTATYDGNQETKEEIVEAYGSHAYLTTPEWTWDEADYSWAKATFICNRDNSHKHEIIVTRAEMDEDVILEPTCSTPGTLKLTATVTFEDNVSTDYKEIEIPATEEHVPDDYGFCQSEGEYLGEEKEIISTITIGAMEEGDQYFCRIEAQPGHIYTLGDADELEQTEVVAYAKVSGVFMPVNLGDVLEASDDGYLYIAVTANSDKLEASFAIYGNHNWNEVGLCLADDNYNGKDIALDTANGPYNPSKNTDYYYRFSATANHKYKLLRTNFIVADFSFYYIDKNGQVVSYTLDEGFPEETYDGFCYIVVNVGDAGVANAKFTIQLLQHDVDDYGFCRQEEIYLGTILEKDTAVAEFVLKPGEKAFFAYQPSSSDAVIEFFTSNSIGIEGLNGKLYCCVDGNWEQVEEDSSNVNYIDYALSFVSDDGYVYLVLENGLETNKTYTNLQVTEL